MSFKRNTRKNMLWQHNIVWKECNHSNLNSVEKLAAQQGKNVKPFIITRIKQKRYSC